MTNITDSELAIGVHIKTEEVIYFRIAWENLMSSFQIPKANQASLFQLMLDHFLTLDHEVIYIDELNNSISALDFLLTYTESFERYKHGKSQAEIDEYGKVKFQV